MMLALSIFALLHVAVPADSITGKWVLKGDVVGNPLNTTCDIKQSDAKLTGVCVNEQGESHAITGEVKDGTITFQHGGDYQGEALTIIYSGKLETPTRLKGTITVRPFDASGTFTATPALAKQ
jgi:hypothetical protein